MINSNQRNEEKRQLSLYNIELLNTGSDERFDRLTRIAVRLFDVPIALVTLIDEERQYFKSLCGVELQPINKMVSFCNWILKTGQPLVIEDTLMNPNFLKNPLVTGYPFIRFYAGYPVRLPGGDIAGAICVLDSSPKIFSPEQMSLLMDLAAIVEDEFELLQIAIKDS
ncbi:TPA: GAF domain-containing protein, partial [Enterobacter asburiae]|nr:GAF domain-containing protein [Escherichia coli]HCR1893050.1 GAF domain-containing protein [Enterobacter asburiae]